MLFITKSCWILSTVTSIVQQNCNTFGYLHVKGTAAVARVPPPFCPHDSKKNCPKLGKTGKKKWEKEKKREKKGRKGKNQEGCLTLPLLTDRAGYATILQFAHNCWLCESWKLWWDSSGIRFTHEFHTASSKIFLDLSTSNHTELCVFGYFIFGMFKQLYLLVTL